MRSPREYCRPHSVQEALAILSSEKPRAAPLAGGTHLMADREDDAEVLVDLQELPLAYVEQSATAVSIGAMTRLSTLCESPELQSFAAGILPDAARHACASLLRNQRTLGGELMARRSDGELAAALIALDATVRTGGPEGQRTSTLADIYRRFCGAGDGTHLKDIILEVTVPAPPAGVLIRCERIARTPMDRAILIVIAMSRINRNVIEEVRITFAGSGMLPARLPELEARLVGTSANADLVFSAVSEAAETIAMPDDHLASQAYRRAMLCVLTRRSVLGI
ncbi:MAG: FAD binding domain-containing protein [Acidobacteriota bacterium]